MNRVYSCIKKLEAKGEAALLSYVELTNPLDSALETTKILIDNGVDILEISFPSVQPWGDGLTKQYAMAEAFKQGVTTELVWEMHEKVRELYPELPIVPMLQYDTIYSCGGSKKFAEKCAKVDADLVLMSGHIYADNLIKHLDENNVYWSTKIPTLTSPPPEGSEIYKSIRKKIEASKGILYVATSGITGGTGVIDFGPVETTINFIKEIQRETGTWTPILIGFGIRTPKQVHGAAEAGGDIVANVSGVLRYISNIRSKPIDEVIQYLQNLKAATKRSK